MKSFAILLACLLSFSAFSQLVDGNLLTLQNYDDEIHSDPTIDFSKYKSFSLISVNQLLKKEHQPLIEKQLEFFYSSVLELVCNLKYIPLTDSIKPDLLVVYNYSNDYKEKYIAPQTYAMPYWKSGSYSSSTINLNSAGTAIVSGDLNLNITGNTNRIATISTSNSGEWQIMQVQKPAYTVGKFFPSFSLVIYDTATDKKVWEGSATATSDKKDFLLSGQPLMVNFAFKLPHGSFIDEELVKDNDGWLGLVNISFNSDGQHFYPVVYYVSENSPAAKSLKFGDVITSINGVSTLNLSNRKIALLKKGNVGTKINFEIERNGRIIKKSITKAKLPK